MFTGIVEELGSVVSLEYLADNSARVRIAGAVVSADLRHGASVAVNGVCLTVVDVSANEFTADVMAPTLQYTTTGSLVAGSAVNLERAVGVADRFGGHVVSGHVDGVGRVLSRSRGGHCETLRISVPASLTSQLAVKGSVAVDGVSLTTFAVSPVSATDDDGWLEVSLIPTTLAETTLGTRALEAAVNIETDVLAKYVNRLLERGNQ